MNLLTTSKLLSVCLSLFLAAQSLFAAEPLNLRVVWAENPQTEAKVLWDSIGEGKGQVVVREGEIKTSHDATATAYSQYRGKNPPADAPPMLSHAHMVELKGLKPSTKYYLTAKVGETASKEYYFITAPDQDVDFKLFFAGDSRSQIKKARAVSEIIRKAFEEDPSYLALIHGGDYTSDSTTPEYTAWLEAYFLTTASDGRLLPIICIRGNHDRGNGFEIAYGGKNNIGTMMFSPHVALSLGMDDESLSKLDQQKVRYRMAGHHRPLYPAVKLQTKKEENPRVAMLEKYNFDLALENDGHCIKRTVPIRNEKMSEDGVVYLGEGGYGAPQKNPNNKLWYLQPPGYAGRGEHYMSLSFTKDAIEYHTMALEGGIVDKATFPAKKR